MKNKIETKGLTFSYAFRFLTDEETEGIVNIGCLGEPGWLVSELLWGLSDSNPGITMSQPEKIIDLGKIIPRLHKALWIPEYDTANGLDLNSMLKYTEQSRYVINAACGERVATTKEVDEAVYMHKDGNIVGIVNKPAVAMSNPEKAFLSLLTWALTGYWRHFKAVGLKIEFKPDGTPSECTASLVLKNYRVIERFCELLETDGYYSGLIDKLNKIKKLGKYKYPDFAQDEIKPDESIAFVVNQVDKLMPKYCKGVLVKARNIIGSHKKHKNEALTTEQKIILRQALIEIRNPGTFNEVQQGTGNQSQATDNSAEIKEMCDIIREGVADGLYSQNEFPIKIVSTLSKRNYRGCSEKQRKFLVEAVNIISGRRKANGTIDKINKAFEKISGNIGNVEKPEAKVDVFQLDGISDLLGKGLLSDE